MKNFLRIFVLALFAVFCFSCADQVDEIEADLKSGHLGSHKVDDMKMVTVPFKAEFMGTYQPWGDKCGLAPNIIVDGVGSGTHIGECTIHFDFCIGPFTPDSVYYGNTYAYIVADNGDSLFVSIEGAVVTPPLPDHPDYVVDYWRDPFVILGGTGRFEGAEGGGWSDDYNHVDYPYNSFHNWEGTITMVKGKRK